jgi:Tfp pilus assembly protein PilF
LGLAYLQNGREPLALQEFGKATEQPGVDPYFNYRYGELLLNNRRPEEAREQLKTAIDRGEGQEPPPPWIWEAHRLLAMALGRQKEALHHWQSFADHAPANSPYLVEAAREMKAILDATGN